jgi:hypothetical protein
MREDSLIIFDGIYQHTDADIHAYALRCYASTEHFYIYSDFLETEYFKAVEDGLPHEAAIISRYMEYFSEFGRKMYAEEEVKKKAEIRKKKITHLLQ